MINFMCELDQAKGCPIAGKTSFWGVSVRGFPEEISRPSTEETITNVYTSQSIGVLIEQTGRGRVNSLLELGHPSSPALRH